MSVKGAVLGIFVFIFCVCVTGFWSEGSDGAGCLYYRESPDRKQQTPGTQWWIDCKDMQAGGTG